MTQLPKIPADYTPCDREEFMNPKQLAYFRKKLLDWRDELLRESDETLSHLTEYENSSEPMDRANAESDRALELRARDRSRKLIGKIDAALERINTGDYGYCDVTGEEISLKRLMARPIATMTLEAQEKHEQNEKLKKTRDRREV